MKLTIEQCETAAAWAVHRNYGLRLAGNVGKIVSRSHAADCLREIRNIIGCTDIIGEQPVRTDWNMMQDELHSLLSIAFLCRGKN